MSKVARGFFWSAVERFSVQGISFILSIIIARIVSPSAYGLIVMVQVFLSFSQLFIDGGFANALIQKKDRNEIDYCTVFIFNMGVAVFLYLLLFFIAPFIADFYEEPQLQLLTRVVSLDLVFSSLSIVQRTRLTINLDFKTQTKAGLTAVIVSGTIGVICAYCGLEVWALVVQGLVNQIVISLMLMFYSHWHPRLCFSTVSFRQLFGFGSKLMVANILTSIYINLSNLIIGKKYTSGDLAFYNRGFTFSQFPSTNISETMNRVIYPMLTKVQDDQALLKSEYLKYLHLSHFVVLPLMGLLLVLAEPLIEFVLTEKWLDTVPYLQIFCINFMFYPILQQSSNPIAAIGHSGVLLKYQFLKRGVNLIILIYTLTIGIRAVCWGIAIGSLLETIVNIFLCRKEIGIGVRETIKSQIDVILSVLTICILIFPIEMIFDSPLTKLVVCGAIGICLYIFAAYLLNMPEKVYLDDFWANIRKQNNIIK